MFEISYSKPSRVFMQVSCYLLLKIQKEDSSWKNGRQNQTVNFRKTTTIQIQNHRNGDNVRSCAYAT